MYVEIVCIFCYSFRRHSADHSVDQLNLGVMYPKSAAGLFVEYVETCGLRCLGKIMSTGMDMRVFREVQLLCVVVRWS